jgi:ABC-2 type transport system ATP-binding protein
MSDHAIEIDQLTKRFGDFTALDELTMRVRIGEVHGFLGPNGAGKSTAIRVLLGLLRATSGDARVLGRDPWTDAVELHRRIAYVPGDVALWPNLSGGEVLDMIASLRGDLDIERRDALVDQFQLDVTKKCRTYSKGNRQKVALIAALASRAELLILDEPTSGLDPLMESLFRQHVREALSVGRTVLLSSHILSEVEALCDRVSIIRDGAIVEHGTLSELRHLRRTHLRVRSEEPLDELPSSEGVFDVSVDPLGATIFTVDPEAMQRVLAYLVARGATALSSAPPTLEELFLHHYEGAAQ